jgi:hypothetical protein
MPKYDDASWHYEGDYPKNLPNESAATHIGMFLAWCINNDFISDELKEDATEEIKRVKSREMTGGEFLIKACDEKFLDDELNEIGNKFTKDYYENDKSKFAKKFGNYGSDFCDVFNKKAEKEGFEYESLYHVEDTWQNYDLLAQKINERFAEWRGVTER